MGSLTFTKILEKKNILLYNFYNYYKNCNRKEVLTNGK